MELSNVREVQVGCDGGRCVDGSGSSVENGDRKVRGNRWHRLVVRGMCIPKRRMAERKKLMTYKHDRNVEEENEDRRT